MLTTRIYEHELETLTAHCSLRTILGHVSPQPHLTSLQCIRCNEYLLTKDYLLLTKEKPDIWIGIEDRDDKQNKYGLIKLTVQ